MLRVTRLSRVVVVYPHLPVEVFQWRDLRGFRHDDTARGGGERSIVLRETRTHTLWIVN